MFFFPFPQCFIKVVMHLKDLESLKGQSLHQQKLLSPTESTASLNASSEVPPLTL